MQELAAIGSGIAVFLSHVGGPSSLDASESRVCCVVLSASPVGDRRRSEQGKRLIRAVPESVAGCRACVERKWRAVLSDGAPACCIAPLGDGTGLAPGGWHAGA